MTYLSIERSLTKSKISKYVIIHYSERANWRVDWKLTFALLRASFDEICKLRTDMWIYRPSCEIFEEQSEKISTSSYARYRQVTSAVSAMRVLECTVEFTLVQLGIVCTLEKSVEKSKLVKVLVKISFLLQTHFHILALRSFYDISIYRILNRIVHTFRIIF